MLLISWASELELDGHRLSDTPVEMELAIIKPSQLSEFTV